jgi:uncharacterized protein (DUF433 family)
MFQIKTGSRQIHGFILSGLFVLLAAANIPGMSQDKPKPEIIHATARGTSTQSGQRIPVRMIINEYSTDEDRQILVEAFDQGKNEGLVNALEKMRAVGRIAIEGVGLRPQLRSFDPHPHRPEDSVCHQSAPSFR